MNFTALLALNWTGFVNRLTDYVHDPAKCAVTNRDLNANACIGHFVATHQTFS